MLCALDFETTGLSITDPVIELAILPLNYDFTENADLKPFNVLIKCSELALERGRDAMLINRITHAELEKYGVESKNVLPMLRGWMMACDATKLDILCQNGIFDMPRFEILIGSDAYREIVSRNQHDTRLAAQYENKIQQQINGEPVYKKTSLKYLAEHFNVKPGTHRAIDDCRTTAAVYRKMISTQAKTSK